MIQRRARASASRRITVVLSLVAGVLAFLAGAMVSMYMPAGHSGWAGLALVPLWLLVEAGLGFLIILGSIPSRPGRISLAVVVLVGFYAGALLVPVIAA